MPASGGHPTTAPDAQRVALYIVAYEAERHIAGLMRRLPATLVPRLAAIHLVDDSSTDGTYATACAEAARLGWANLSVHRTPANRGYGGNQKRCYLHAIAQGYTLAALLHGDAQYPPEDLPRLLEPFADPTVDAVLGSRMLEPGAARRGGMPLYKRICNRILTTVENRLLRADLSEFHTGYRIYRVAALAGTPFAGYHDGFVFDNEILVGLLAARRNLREVAVTPSYGDQICRVPLFRYAAGCCLAALRHRLGGDGRRMAAESARRRELAEDCRRTFAGTAP